jgi:hypothetical protein
MHPDLRVHAGNKLLFEIASGEFYELSLRKLIPKESWEFGINTDACYVGDKGSVYSPLVIDRKQILLFWPKTNIRQGNAAEFSADNEYSAQGSK